MLDGVFDWLGALFRQIAALPYDPSSPTRIRDGFLVEAIALSLAYLLGAHAQRRRDGRAGKRGVASDIVRDLRELKDASFCPKDLRPAEKARAATRLFGTIDLARDRLRLTERELKHLEAVRRAVAAYAAQWGRTKLVRENEIAHWRAMIGEVERGISRMLGDRAFARGRFDDLRELRECCETAES